MILMIDNYDSFTFNLYQYIGEFYKDIKVVRNDKISIEEIAQMKPEKIVISPGPKTPDEAGISMDVIKEFGDKIPILGICLGHQCIGKVYGSEVSYAKEIMHGKISLIEHYKDDLFEGVDSTFTAARYHSLSIVKDSISDDLVVTALARDDGEIMAVKHKEYPVYGLQFHPESICTESGKRIIKNFVSLNNI